MHQGGGDTGHGQGGHQPGHNGHHHRHLNGGVPANAPSGSVNWAMAMKGEREKFWVTLLRTNKLRLLAVSSIGMFFVMWLFVIDYSNQNDRAARAGSGNAWTQRQGSETWQGMPMQASATPSSAEPSENGIPSAFGTPRSSFEVPANSHYYPNQLSSFPAVSQSTSGGYPSGSSSPDLPQSFGAQATRFGSPQATMPARTHTLERYRMVVSR